MGSLLYGMDGAEVEFDDRTLAHLHIVIVSKLRRQESFGLSYQRAGLGREVLWLHPAIPLRFRFTEQGDRTSINRAWLDELTRTAAHGELRVVPETNEDAAHPE